MRKKQDPKKRAQDEFDKRQQHRLNRPLHGPKKKSSVQIEFEKYRKLQDQIDFSQKSPEFGQNKAWVREGREPSWSKDREHLMRIFSKNVEDMLEPDAYYAAPLRDKLAVARFHSDREARYLKEYNTTGLGDLSRSMRLPPVPIGAPRIYDFKIGKFKNDGDWHSREMRKEYSDSFRLSDSYKNQLTESTSVDTRTGKTQISSPSRWGSEHIDATASSIPRKQFYARGQESTIWLDHNRDKSLDTPAVKREMAHYDQLHGFLQKQDKGARAMLNVFRAGGLRRR